MILYVIIIMKELTNSTWPIHATYSPLPQLRPPSLFYSCVFKPPEIYLIVANHELLMHEVLNHTHGSTLSETQLFKSHR